MTSVEKNWAQIEKETLAVVFGLEHFDQYTYGRRVVIENDHKPLAAILKKPLSQAPKRLQALILRLHRYDVDFHYMEGSKLFIADTLSKAYLDVPDTHVRVMKVNALKRESDERINEVREATAEDESMQKLLSIIRDGWPDNKNEVPSELKLYFDVRGSKPSRRCYFEGRKNCDPKVAKRHYKEEAALSTYGLRQHDETRSRYCILARNVT